MRQEHHRVRCNEASEKFTFWHSKISQCKERKSLKRPAIDVEQYKGVWEKSNVARGSLAMNIRTSHSKRMMTWAAFLCSGLETSLSERTQPTPFYQRDCFPRSSHSLKLHVALGVTWKSRIHLWMWRAGYRYPNTDMNFLFLTLPWWMTYSSDTADTWTAR